METTTEVIQITNAQEIMDIIFPIPANMFITGIFGTVDGKSCFLGHIHRKFSPNGKDYFGDLDGYGARELTSKFLLEHHKISNQSGASVNNNKGINGYNEEEIKDRVVHMLQDMIDNGY